MSLNARTKGKHGSSSYVDALTVPSFSDGQLRISRTRTSNASIVEPMRAVAPLRQLEVGRMKRFHDAGLEKFDKRFGGAVLGVLVWR